MLYACVFVFRYLDLFKSYRSFALAWYTGEAWHFIWNFVFKIFYLASSFYVIYAMMKVFPRTRERERAWKLALWSVAGSLVLAPIVISIFERKWPDAWFIEVGTQRLIWYLYMN